MTSDPKSDLHRYLQIARDALLWKLDGASEYDVRRPMTPTGTNLLGLVKHVASCEIAYFGDTFGRPFAVRPAWFDKIDEDPHVDMWATADESREDIVELYRAVQSHSDATIDALELSAPGRVPHWPADRAETTLHQILVHMIAETDRHAGHADIIRELMDGSAGLRKDSTNLTTGDEEWWKNYREKLERTAREVGGLTKP
ncbi:DinB family protein [Amycolatopsis sp. NPDC059021]|uniref:DinB family protein n=1 Tax=Amycolatopsis sp. NPDC059021 TaxID=3346704 RepID=UPI00367075EB